MSDEVRSEKRQERAFYETPKVIEHGSFEMLTQHSSSGRRFDLSFNAGDLVTSEDVFS